MLEASNSGASLTSGSRMSCPVIIGESPFHIVVHELIYKAKEMMFRVELKKRPAWMN
jgi:hypothetical protein